MVKSFQGIEYKINEFFKCSFDNCFTFNLFHKGTLKSLIKSGDRIFIKLPKNSFCNHAGKEYVHASEFGLHNCSEFNGLLSKLVVDQQTNDG